jgi:hypothetical protein
LAVERRNTIVAGLGNKLLGHGAVHAPVVGVAAHQLQMIAQVGLKTQGSSGLRGTCSHVVSDSRIGFASVVRQVSGRCCAAERAVRHPFSALQHIRSHTIQYEKCTIVWSDEKPTAM